MHKGRERRYLRGQLIGYCYAIVSIVAVLLRTVPALPLTVPCTLDLEESRGEEHIAHSSCFQQSTLVELPCTELLLLLYDL